MKITRDTLAFALALGAGATAYGFFGVREHQRRVAVLDDRVRVAHTRVGEEEERASHLEQLMTDVAWLREALDGVHERMQSAAGTPQFLFGLAEVLRIQGLEAEALDPLQRVEEPPLLRQAVQLEVRGSFDRLAKLVTAIESLAPLCRVTSLEIEHAAPGLARNQDRLAPLLRARLRVVRFWSAEP